MNDRFPERDPQDDPWFGLGNCTPEQAEELRRAANNLGIPHSHTSRHLRFGRTRPPVGEEGIEILPAPELSPEQQAINEKGYQHPAFILLREKLIMEAAGDNPTVAAAMLRAHYERNRRS